MMFRAREWARLSVLAVLMIGIQLPASSQSLTDGEWTGFMFSPGRQLMDITIYVMQGGRTADLEFAIGRFPMSDIKVDDKSISFRWTPEFEVECLLAKLPEGFYEGSCKDEWDNKGPMLFAPPTVNVTPEHFDIDRSMAVWGDTEEITTVAIQEFKELPLQSVEVGGTTIQYVSQGTDGPTVVFESGLADEHTVWNRLIPALSASARAVAYDRPGIGRSGPALTDRTPAQMATELSQFLEAIEVTGPVILVAHAEGAFTARHFADQYPDKVGGLVLIDPSHEMVGSRMDMMSDQSWQSYLSKRDVIFKMMSSAGSGEWESFKSINEAQTLGTTGPPDAPMLILSPTDSSEDPGWFGESDRGRSAIVALQGSLASTSPEGKQLLIDGTGSYIQAQRPDVVLEAIRTVIQASR